MYAIECNRSGTVPDDAEFLKRALIFLRTRDQRATSEKRLIQTIAKLKAKPGVMESISGLVRQDSMGNVWKTIVLPAPIDRKRVE